MTDKPFIGPEDKFAVTVPNAGDLIGVGRSTAYQLVASGELPCFKVGRLKRVSTQALREWVARKTLAAAKESELGEQTRSIEDVERLAVSGRDARGQPRGTCAPREGASGPVRSRRTCREGGEGRGSGGSRRTGGAS
jgi:excisionase family DNA binding protein